MPVVTALRRARRPTASLRPWPAAARSLLVLAPLLALGACGATERMSPAHATEGVWPQPAVDVPEPATTVMTRPDFQAPSAVHCARPVQTETLPGRQAAPWPARGAGEARGRVPKDAARAERLAEAASGRVDGGSADASLAAAPSVAPAPAAPPPAPAAGRFAEPAATGRELADGAAAAGRQAPADAGPVTAGMVDDNADFDAYLRFRQRHAQLPQRRVDVSERYLLEVRSSDGAPVPDAEVMVRAASGAALWARSDAGGRVWLHPRAFDPQGAAGARYQVLARKNGRQAGAWLRRGQASALEVRLEGGPAPERARLDLVFLVDATGSMGDEIAKLRTSLRRIAADLGQLPSQPDLCLGLVAYRDHDDAFLLQRSDLSNDLEGLQSALNALQAAGGGDYPEALGAALDDTVHRIRWRGDGTTRIVVLLADAPPHLDRGDPPYDAGMRAALGRGIKIFSVGASGLDRQGEVIQRQLAQYTGGRFVFLTYRDARDPGSGAGRETLHEVRNFSVESLDRLIVRLVSSELARLPKPGGGV